MAENRRTSLFPWHAAHGANIAKFHGWDMPLWYASGAKKEHLSVITAAGIFDTGHMGALSVTGRDAFHLLQSCFTKDLERCLGGGKAPLTPGRCVYGVFLNERGETIDDAIVYQLTSQDYLVIVNAGMAAAVGDHLQRYSAARSAGVADVSEKMAKIDLQGPHSARILAKVLADGPALLRSMVYFSFKGTYEKAAGFSGVRLARARQILLSRTGYTGEFGFELFVNPADALEIWETLLEAGEEFGLLPCGLAARDSLRAGAVLPLSGQDIGSWPYINHPWLFALPFAEDGLTFTKQFIGDIVLQLREASDHTLAFVGFDPRKASIGDPALGIGSDGNEIGLALTCVADLAIGRVNGAICSVASPQRPQNFNPLGLCCGFAKVRSRLEPGTHVVLRDKRREIPVEIVKDIRPDRTARLPMKHFLGE
ncbi:MAG: aminomethyl transferase family protein [Candidatus Abyssobacteria bacterium SURF_5]|uniref:Aminomethyl transferase family protein n=1 Tax=Abyssobacteria bacterium (strain SURF_5) TaxID=2093360 RepID=A0A3A4NZK4_ABYX5|nr:MAG: aminomethyl transferase family protein [Candidatus Abyssubacteria bacterium SURF_5]